MDPDVAAQLILPIIRKFRPTATLAEVAADFGHPGRAEQLTADLLDYLASSPTGHEEALEAVKQIMSAPPPGFPVAPANDSDSEK